MSTAPTDVALSALQDDVGRRFDFIYRFHDIDGVIPDASERQAVVNGNILHVSIDARRFSGRDDVTWAQVANGRYDRELTLQARGIASLRRPVFVTFDHEANQPSRQSRGTPADFIRAWRHLHRLYAQAGVTNVVWVWVMIGSPDGFARAASLWPGNDYVDWISWDVYNQSGCRAGHVNTAKYMSFESAMSPFYRWVHREGPRIGMDPDKPMMISEAASVVYRADAKKTAEWYAQIPSVLSRFPQIKAIGLWNRPGSKEECKYQFQSHAQVLGAVAAAGRESWVSPLPENRRSR